MQNDGKQQRNVSFQNFTNAVRAITSVPKDAVSPKPETKKQPHKDKKDSDKK